MQQLAHDRRPVFAPDLLWDALAVVSGALAVDFWMHLQIYDWDIPRTFLRFVAASPEELLGMLIWHISAMALLWCSTCIVALVGRSIQQRRLLLWGAPRAELSRLTLMRAWAVMILLLLLLQLVLVVFPVWWSGLQCGFENLCDSLRPIPLHEQPDLISYQVGYLGLLLLSLGATQALAVNGALFLRTLMPSPSLTTRDRQRWALLLLSVIITQAMVHTLAEPLVRWYE